MAITTTPVLVLVAASSAPTAVKNVAEYVCDGTADQTEINSALADVASTGGLVQLTPGTFNLSATITPTKGNAILRGSGWATILSVNNSTNIYAITFSPPASTLFDGFVVADLKIDCNGNNQTTAGGGIDGFGAVWCRFEHLWIRRPWHNGIYLHQDNLGGYGHHNVIDSCFFDEGEISNGGDGRGVRLDQSDENVTSNCTFQANGRAAAGEPNHYFDLAGLNTVTGCQFVTGQTAVKIQGAHSHCTNNTFDGCQNHMVRLNGDKNVVSHNQFFNLGYNKTANTIDGIWVDNVQYNTIVGNSFVPFTPGAQTNGTRSAINLSSGPSTNCLVQGNTMTTLGGGSYGTATIIPGTGAGHIIRNNNGYSDTLFARKTADESVTSSTTLQDDDHLQVTVEPNSVYEVTSMLLVDGSQAGDISIAWTVPSGATFDWTPDGLTTAAASRAGSINRAAGDATTVTLGVGTVGTGLANRTVTRPAGLLVVGSTGGAFRLRWAQLVSDATATTLITGSYLKLQRVA